MAPSHHRRRLLAVAVAMLLLLACPAANPAIPIGSADSAQGATRVDGDGTVHIRDLSVSPSGFMSDQARTAWIAAHRPSAAAVPLSADVESLRRFYGASNDRLAARMKEIYPVTIEPATIGGVRVEIITPRDGTSAANADRVLVNLHGGGFMWGEGSGGQVESIPIAAVGRITVISVAYRMAPEYRFPAASEDVAAVYAALLADHRPSEIGIYGCSAGGILTAQSVAWILRHGMPAPGAIGTFCASAAPLGGDSMEIMPALNSEVVEYPGGAIGYLSGVDWRDPLVAPVNSVDLLANFPPTLLLAGSRDFALSSLFYTQRRMTIAKTETQLHVWDGLPHAFFTDPDLPESREVYDVVADFFARHLG